MINLCRASNVISMDEGSKQLFAEFCRCPAAAELLDKTASLFQTISIYVGHYPKSSAQTSGLAVNEKMKELDPLTAERILKQSIDEQTFTIFIDQREFLKKKKLDFNSRLESLAFELGNGMQKEPWNAQVVAAYKGDLARDDYAIQTEKMEWVTRQNTDRILNACKSVWKIVVPPQRPGEDIWEEMLFSQEIAGHTDFMRRQWYDCCKKAYCEKHPKDAENCNRKKSDFIDFHALMEKSDEERHNIVLQRIRQNLHKAPDRLRREMLGEFDTPPSKTTPTKQEL